MEVFVPADKTRNLYEMDKAQCKKLLRENITRHDQSASEEAYDDINTEAGVIAAKLQIADRMKTMARKEAFLTLKDHKENFDVKLSAGSSTRQRARWEKSASRSLMP